METRDDRVLWNRRVILRMLHDGEKVFLLGIESLSC